MKEKLKYLDTYKMELPFKILYLIFAFFSFCNMTYGQPIMSVLVDMVLLLGAVTIACRLMKIKGYLQTKGIVFLILFCVSYTISLVLNYKYGLSDNLKYLVWTGFHFFMFYMCDVDRDIKEYEREFNIISWVFIGSTFILVSGSLIMYYMGISIIDYEHQGEALLAGIVWGRLWGLFKDPNYASAFATIAGIFAYYKITKTRRRVVKVFLVFTIIADVLYIALSDSRTGILCVFSCTFVYMLLMKLKSGNKKYIRIIVATVAFSIVMATVPVLLKNINNSIITLEEEITESDTEDNMTIGREEDLKGNFSNRRTDLWVSALEISKTSPIIGVSFFNIVPYAEKNLPETYLVNNDLGVFNNFHNMPFNLLVGQGILGLCIMIVFGCMTVVYIFKHLSMSEGGMYEYQVVLITGVVASLECSMFVTDILYTNSPMSVIFWLFLGYLVHYTKKMTTVKPGA